MAGNFQQMGGLGGHPMQHMQPQQLPQQQQQGPGNNQVQQHIFNAIRQSSGVSSGWQANVNIQERVANVWQL